MTPAAPPPNPLTRMRGEASYRVGARGPGWQLGRVTEPRRVGCGGDGGDGEGRGRGRERPEADGRPQGQRRSVGTVPQDGARHRPSARDALALANTEPTQTPPVCGETGGYGISGAEGPRLHASSSRGGRHADGAKGNRRGDLSARGRHRPSARLEEGERASSSVSARREHGRDGSASGPLSKQERRRLGQRLRNTGGTSGGGLARLPRRTRVARGHGTCRRGRLPAGPGSAHRGRPRGARSRGSRRGPAGRARAAQAGRLHGATRRPEAGPGPGPGSAGAERWWRSAPRGVGAGRGVVSKVAVLVCARPRDGHGTGVREASRPEQGE